MLRKYLIIQCTLVIFYVLLIHWQLISNLSSPLVLTTLYLGLIILILSNVFFFRLANQVMEKNEDEAVRDLENFYLAKSEDLEENLRVYRHDFINHLQVIYGFLQLKKFDKACEYISQAREKIYEIRQKQRAI